MSDSPQRRQVDRPPNPPATWLVQADQLTARMMSNLRHHWKGRIVFTLLFVLCLGSLWWSLYERLPMLDGSKTYMKHLNHLQSEVEILKQQWRDARVVEVNDALARYETMLMPDMESVDAWIKQVMVQANMADMSVSYVIGDLEMPSIALNGVRFLRLSMTIESSKDDLSLSSLMTFFNGMTAGLWHVDVVQLEMDGQSEGVEKITVTLRVWMKASDELDQLMSKGVQ